jgi:predicted PurR-regulated permease PerM
VREILSEMFKHVRGVLVHNARDFAGELLGVVGLIPSLILAPFLAYYMIKDFDHFKRRFLATLPPAYRRDVLRFLHEADLLFSKFLRGDLSISLLVGIFTGIGAALIGMKYYLIAGIITALADLVPIFGPVLAAIPVVGLALAESRLKGALMLAVFLLVQELESSILTPRLLGDRMGMHPLVIILVLLVGGYLYGALGMIFSVPVAGLLRVAWRFMWARVL